MAGEVVSMGPEAEVWLQSDDLLFHQQHETKKSVDSGSPCRLGLPTEFPYDYLSSDSFSSSSSSNPSSPVESATESDDDLDEYLVGLTAQMAHSFLQEAEDDGADKKLSCSPPCPSGDVGRTFLMERETSRPAPTNDDTDQGMRVQQEMFGGLSFPVPQAWDGCGFPISDACAGLRNYHYRYGFPQQPQHRLQLKHRQLVNQQLAAAASWRNGSPGGGAGQHLPLGLPPPPLGVGNKSPHGVGVIPPPAPPQPGSGMRAVFLPGGLSQKPSTGTGVFLPRRAWGPTQMRCRSACSTVLMPVRVVHALNLEAAGETQPAGHCGGDVGVPLRRPRGDADARAGGNTGAAAVASYSSLVDAGGAALANNDTNNSKSNNNKKKTSSCGGERLRLGRFPPQEEEPQRQPPKSPSPETRLPPEWIY